MRLARRPLLVGGAAACLVALLAGLPARAQPAPAPAAAAAAAWPHDYTVGNARVAVYQPQAISWKDRALLASRTAMQVTLPGAPAPVLGTVDLTHATSVDMRTRTVSLSDPKLVGSRFPTLDTAQAARLEEQIKGALGRAEIKTVPLDALLLALKETPPSQSVAVNNDPPAIFYSQTPASLVVFDGEPVLVPVGKAGLSFAVNTNWDVIADGSAWYLLNNSRWLSAPAYAGPYAPVAKLPPAFTSIPADGNFAELRKAIPPAPAKGPAPAIFVSTKPAEIIVVAGAPQFAPVPGTGLQVVKNTTSDLFFHPAGGKFYYLISGRWFAAPGLDGPWTFATNDLPADFALIQPDGPNGKILASVPNTAQAQAAVLQAQIPHQASLKRDQAKLTVTYAGPPQFKPIPGTTIAYAANTQFQVLQIGGRYYACYQGAWFVALTPNGPWALAESVPPEVRTIPPSSPMYPVTYVTVVSSSPATVTFAYTAGYTMAYVSAGVLVYGTGYYYPPVIVPGPVPVYMPYPYSYAGGVWYNPTTGAWARGGTVYGPYGGVATGGTYYNPTTGTVARGGEIYGPNGGAGAFSVYNPTTGSYARGSASWGTNGGSANASFYNASTGRSGTTNQNWNQYERWGSSTITTPTQTVNTRSQTTAQGSAGAFSSTTGAEGAGYRGAGGNSGGAVKTAGGDVYAGHDGNVYKHTSDGWEKWNDGSWSPVQPPQNAPNRQPTGQAPTETTPQSRQAQAQSAAQTRQAPTEAGAPTRRPATQSTEPARSAPSAQGRAAPTETAGRTPLFANRTGGAPASSGSSLASRFNAPQMEHSSFQQLEQDRFARSAGGQFGAARAGGGLLRRR